MLSLEECAPNRPPRSQKCPLASGTEKFETTIGSALDRDVDEPHHLPRLLAFVEDLLVDDHDDVARSCRPCPWRIRRSASAASGRWCARR